uniref:ribonuclease H n=1 Tax=Setaria digitata TaxID=48799 RepID=A0A915PRC3_9BILA
MDSKSETSNCGGSSKPLKPYLCSMNGCFTYEILRIDCQQCGFNFCLQHRYPEEHQCHIENVVNTHIKSVHQKEVMKNMAMVTVSGKSYRVADPLSQLQKKETVDEATRRRADRIAVMRLKGNIQNSYVTFAISRFLFQSQSKCFYFSSIMEGVKRLWSRRMSISSLAKLSRCFYCYNAVPSVALSVNHFSSVPDFDALTEKVQHWKEKLLTGNVNDSDDISSGDKIIENRAWMSAPLVYCDGSFDWTLRKGGIGIFWSPNDERNAHLSLTGPKLTNIRAEIQAVSLAALQACSLKFERVIIKTDSQFVVKVINSWLSRWRSNEWKKSDGKQIENMDDIQKLSLFTEMIKIRVDHTYGHQKYDEMKELENWGEMSCDEKDRCGNFYSDRLSRLAIHQPMMTDEQFEQLCKAKLNKQFV